MMQLLTDPHQTYCVLNKIMENQQEHLDLHIYKLKNRNTDVHMIQIVWDYYIALQCKMGFAGKFFRLGITNIP